MAIIFTPIIIIILVILFYRLAKKYGKESIRYRLLGIVVFIVCFFIAEIVSIQYLTLLESHGIIDKRKYLGRLYLSTLTIGIYLSRRWYKYLENKWQKEEIIFSDPDILDDEMLG